MKTTGTLISFVVCGAVALSTGFVHAEDESAAIPAGLWGALSEARHAVEPAKGEGASGFRAQSPANHLVFHFGEDGLTVKPGVAGQDWSLTMSLVARGQEGAMRAVGDAEMVAKGRRIEYRRSGITEWYVNDNRGLEQGFTLEKPEVYDPDQPAVLSIHLIGELSASTIDDRKGLSFTDRAGSLAIRYSGLTALDADGNDLPAALELADNRLEIRVEVGDHPWPVTVDPVISSESKLLGLHDDAEASDRFGVSVAVSGDTALVGAEGDDDDGSSSGSAYVFIRFGGRWIFQAKLSASDAAAGDTFGASVSIDGDTALVGAYFENGAGISRGAAYVFSRSGTEWSEQAKLTASDGGDNDNFGYSVSLSGDTALVGAVGDSDDGSASGSAYVFFRTGTTWSQQQKLTAPDAVANDQFGSGVSVFGDTAVVGVPGNDFAASAAGAVHVFVRSGSVWSHQARLTAADAAVDDILGESVSLSGDTVIAGARGDDDAGAYSGSAYVFFRSGTTWSQQQKLTASDAAADDQFGTSVSVSGDTAVVGAHRDDDSASNSGSAYVLVRVGTVWTQQQKLTVSDPAAGDFFGSAVCVSGDVVLTGALFGDAGVADSGSAYVFHRFGTTWTEEQEFTPMTTVADDSFGVAVSVSGDTALIGASGDDDGFSNGGAAYLFSRSGAIWGLQQKLIPADVGADDAFGSSVVVSQSTAVVGAPYEDDAGVDAGAAYVFVRSGNTWGQQAKLTGTDTTDGDWFATSVSLSRDTAIVGAPEDDDAGTGSGSAYVFVRSGGIWSQQTKLTASDAALGDDFGDTVSVSGETAVVGASYNDDVGDASGSAYVFVRSGTTWSEEAKLTASDATTGDQFGEAVVVLGDTALIGALGDDDGGFSTGSTYVFVRSGTNWKEDVKLTASDPNVGKGFGDSLSLMAKTALVGAYGDDDAGSYSGAAQVFVRAGYGWLESAKLTASDASASDYFGSEVSVSADTVLVGAYGDDDGANGSGSAYLFEFPCGFGAGVAPGRWSMIGLPCDPGGANTVEDVLGDNLWPADYGLTWIVYERDEANDVYLPLTLTSPLQQGAGYWIYSTEWAVWDVAGAHTPYVTSGLCVSPKGCYEITLTPPDAPTTHRWNLVGQPGNKESNWSGVAVIVDGTRYNSPSDAEDAGFISKNIHKWVGTSYEALDDVTPGMEGYLYSQEGFWVEALPDSSGHTVKLLIPDGLAPGAPPGPPGKSKPGPPEVGEWYLRLIAESTDGELIDRGNVVGQLLESEDGYDAHDLFELPPFADPHLTIVLPHPDWGDRAGDYTSDYHLSRGRVDDEWIFEVRTDDPNRKIRLAWASLRVLESEEPEPGEQRQWVLSDASGEALMDTMWLQDLATGELIKAAEDGAIADYTFNMNGEAVRVFRWYAELTALGTLFADGFESGDTMMWSEVEP